MKDRLISDLNSSRLNRNWLVLKNKKACSIWATIFVARGGRRRQDSITNTVEILLCVTSVSLRIWTCRHRLISYSIPQAQNDISDDMLAHNKSRDTRLYVTTRFWVKNADSCHLEHLETTIFSRQLGCLTFSLRFWPRRKQRFSNCQAWSFSLKTADFH